MLLVLGHIDASAPSGGILAPEVAAVAAGFPSPAQDHFRGEVDLNEHLVLDRTSTFILRVQGDSMTSAGIFDGDEILVDRSLDAGDGDVVVAVVDGELTVKRLVMRGGRILLRAESGDPKYADIPLTGEMQMTVWGVVTRSIHRLRP